MSKTPSARADRLLANLGYGSRREVQGWIEQGAVSLDGVRVRTVGQHIPLGPDLVDRMTVKGSPLDPPAPLTLIMHKPLGLVCSHREEGRNIYELLPSRWRSRDPALSSIGRLDAGTTGLLLITDDGPLLHRIVSPKTKVAKRYRVELARSMSGEEAAVFASGEMMLDSETTPLAPAVLEVLSPTRATLTITEGRYHQVRRMFAALSNHVTALHRESVGGLELPEELTAGDWRRLRPEELSTILEIT